MPLTGTGHSNLVLDDAPYFRSLPEFDAWADRMPPTLNGILRYCQRPSITGVTTEGRGKLLVCHDYKGGYTESPSTLSYTFNYWPWCDSFIYFSHHRVTVPPSGWITAAHRQGVKMLGTLIFEGADEGDCLRLLVGRLPKSRTGPVQAPQLSTIPVSPHYAGLFAALARQRGFDGYLLNFECPLQGGVEQTQALTAWIALLERELKAQVGPHSQVIWYDSVIADGRLRWQDRLNSVNLPFFIPSSAFFTNYTWPPHYPSLTAEYFLSIDPQHHSHPRSQPKSLRDIYVGVDVWGRGSHGGGGFGLYKAISHIDPLFLGLSVALFGPAWTWESEQDKPGWDWDKWWAYDRKLWLGPTDPSEVVQVPEMPQGSNQPVCVHGPFTPITSAFARNPPPDPIDLVFNTSFCPGVGKTWFVEGVKVMQAKNGWADLSKTNSLGDLVWPRPSVTSELDDFQGAPPVVAPSLDMDDAWMGGSSLRLSLTVPADKSGEGSFLCFWVPVQSLALTVQQSYDIKLFYKIESGDDLDLDLGLSAKSLTESSESQPNIQVTPLPVEITHLPGGWSQVAVQVRVKANVSSHVLVGTGLVIGIALEQPTTTSFSILLGQLTAFLSPPPPPTTISEPQLIWADYQKHGAHGVLTWEVAQSLPPVAGLSLTSLEDPQPAWILDAQMRTFLYFNIYAERGASNPAQQIFLGTSGLDGRGNRFFVDSACLPAEIVQWKGQLRFIIQGVTDRGEVLSRERCVFVDVEQNAD